MQQNYQSISLLIYKTPHPLFNMVAITEEMKTFMLYFMFTFSIIIVIALFFMYEQILEIEKDVYVNQNISSKNQDLMREMILEHNKTH